MHRTRSSARQKVHVVLFSRLAILTFTLSLSLSFFSKFGPQCAPGRSPTLSSSETRWAHSCGLYQRRFDESKKRREREGYRGESNYPFDERDLYYNNVRSPARLCLTLLNSSGSTYIYIHTQYILTIIYICLEGKETDNRDEETCSMYSNTLDSELQ